MISKWVENHKYKYAVALKCYNYKEMKLSSEKKCEVIKPKLCYSVILSIKVYALVIYWDRCRHIVIL